MAAAGATAAAATAVVEDWAREAAAMAAVR